MNLIVRTGTSKVDKNFYNWFVVMNNWYWNIIILLVFINQLIHKLTGNPDITAVLPLISSIILICLSVVLTLIGGLIPSRIASKKDPVEALRTE